MISLSPRDWAILGHPAMADKATLIVLLSGDHRSKEVAYILATETG